MDYLESTDYNIFNLSVIIPVYDAEKYVLRAVESVLQQPETGEVILIEDKSTDNSLHVCKDLEKEYSKVKLYQHLDKKNHGAAVSRNMGVEKSKYDYIAFLDADDFYLDNRFTHVKKIFSDDSAIDGVYDAIGTHFESPETKKLWLKNSSLNLLTTMTKIIKPEDLFIYLLLWTYGHFSLDGLTVKKDALYKTGLFDNELLLHQDTSLCIKLSKNATLVPGQIEKPVAMRRVHGANRTANKNINFRYTRYMLWKNLYRWTKHVRLEKKERFIVFRNYINAKKTLYKYERNILIAGYYIIISKFLSKAIKMLFYKYY